MKAFWKDFFREISKNKGRFLSVFFIVLLGSAFFSGIRSAEGDMKVSADRYYDDVDYMDLKILGTMGLTDEDLKDIQNTEGVKNVAGGHTLEVLHKVGEKEQVVKLIALTDKVNEPQIKEGRMPENSDEILVDESFLSYSDCKIGDKVTFESGTDEAVTDSLTGDTFTIVGTATLPYYMDLNRGTGSIGTGSINSFALLEPEVFTSDVYTELYVQIDGAKESASYSDEYDKTVKKVQKKIEALEDSACDRRYQTIQEEGQQEIADAKEQIQDAEEKLADAKQKLDDGEVQLSDARTTISKKEQELNDGESELKAKEAELESGKQTLVQKTKELESAKTQITEKTKELESGKQALESGKKELEANKIQLAQKEQELNAGKTQLEEAKTQFQTKIKEFETGKSQYEEKKSAYEAQRSQIETAKTQLEAVSAGITQIENALTEMKNQLEILEDQLAKSESSDEIYETLLAQKTELESQITAQSEALSTLIAQKEALEAGISEFESAKPEAEVRLEEARIQIEEAGTQIEQAKATLSQKEEELNAGQVQIDSAKKQLQEAEEKIKQNEAIISDGEAQLVQAQNQIKEGESQILEAQKTLADGEKQLTDAKQTLAKGRTSLEEAKSELEAKAQELEDGKAEYETAKKDAEPEITDAKQKISDGEEELAKLEVPTWYVWGRDKITSTESFGQDAERISNIGEFFPVIFFLVAALVSLTTMTRMIEEQRQQIGTLKALGYSDGKIALKYFAYAMVSTVSGALAGVVVGEKILPWVIMNAYGMLYTGLPYYLTPLNWHQGGLAVLASAGCTGVATLAACQKELMSKPAELMRPQAPKNGKRIFLERIDILWKHLNFTQKSTVRNLVRYKKRFFMTVIGIGGCMGLILVGFGLQDSITAIAKNQFVNLFTYEANVILDSNVSEAEKEAQQKDLKAYQGIDEMLELYCQNVELQSEKKTVDTVLEVPKTLEGFEDFFEFRDRVSGKHYAFPKEGAAISEKTADMLGVKVGDTVELKKGDTIVKVKISVIVENYVRHYLYLTTETYESLFHETPNYNQLLLRYQDTSKDYEDALGEKIMKYDSVAAISFTSDLIGQIDDMLRSLDIVIVVLIVSAGLLAFVVLYNLNNINITERQRELATLKVLGFYDGEVASYVYRENIVLTLFGIIAGMGIGNFLHHYVIQTVEVDMMMFGRNVFFRSYFYSGFITLAFALFVNGMMFYRLRKIDMIESLKSVE